MTAQSRRGFMKRGIALAGAAFAAPAAAVAGTSAALPYEIRASSRAPFAPVRVVDTEKMPWQLMAPTDPALAKYPGSRKYLFRDEETKAHLMITAVPPGWPGAPVHYHDFHEWGYKLSGDGTNNESTSPEQHFGPLMRFREGHFLSRPPFSLHGGERHRQDFMRSQVGGSWFFMEEGDVAKRTFSTERGNAMIYVSDHSKIKQWTVPRIIDTIGEMPFEPSATVPGLHHKYLMDDQSRGFRVMLWWLEPGWNSSQSPQFAKAYYRKEGYQFNFIVAGDLKIQTYQAPGQKGELISLGKYFYVERPPMSIFGLADGVVTERGCVWLEGTYGKGVTISTTPIEEPTYV
jgi:hypothetical protein